MQLARTSLPARRAFFSTNGSGLLMRPLAPQRIVKGRVAADGQVSAHRESDAGDPFGKSLFSPIRAP